MIHRILNYFGYRLVTVNAGSGAIIDRDFGGHTRRSNIKWDKFTKIIRNNKALAIDRFGSKFTIEKGVTDYRDHIILFK